MAHGCTSVVRPLRIHAVHRIPIDVAKPIAADEVWSVCVCVCVCACACACACVCLLDTTVSPT